MTTLARANLALRNKNFEEALLLYKKFIAQNPSFEKYLRANIEIAHKRVFKEKVVAKFQKSDFSLGDHYKDIQTDKENDNKPKMIIMLGSFNMHKVRFAEMLEKEAERRGVTFLWIQDSERYTYDKTKITFSPLFVGDIDADEAMMKNYPDKELVSEVRKFAFLIELQIGSRDATIMDKYFDYSFRLDQLLRRNKVELVLIWHQFRPLGHIMQFLCKRYGILHYFVEWGSLPGTLSVDDKGQMALSHVTQVSIDEQREKVSTKSLSKASLYTAYASLSGFRRRALKGEIYDVKAIAEFHRSRGKKIVFFAGANDAYAGIGSKEDPYFYEHSPLGLTSFDALKQLLVLANTMSLHVIYKPHPDHIGESDELERLEKNYRDILSVGKSFVFNSCIETSDLVATTVSQTAYAALIKRRPVLLFGKMQLSNKGCCWEVKNRSQLSSILKVALDSGLTEKQRRLFLLHVAYLLEYELLSYEGGVLESSYGAKDELLVKKILGSARESDRILNHPFTYSNERFLPEHREESYPVKFNGKDFQLSPQGIRIVFYCMSPPSGLSGGRLHAWLMAATLSDLGFYVTFVTDHEPVFIQDMYRRQYSVGEGMHYEFYDIVNNNVDFDSIPSDVFVYVPHASCHGIYSMNALNYIENICPKVILLNFESETFFNKYSPKRKPSSHWQGWKEIAVKADLILSSTRVSHIYALKDYRQIKEDTSFDYLYPPLNLLGDLNICSKLKKRSVVSFVRTSAEHKGAEKIIELLSDDLRGYTYHLISGRELSDEFKKRFTKAAKSNGINVETHIGVDEARKFEILKQAQVHIFPSLFEGFGLPPLEATAVGTITIAFDLPVLREVNNERSVFFARFGDVDDMKRKLKKLLKYEYDPEEISRYAYPNADKSLYSARLSQTILSLVGVEHLRKILQSNEDSKIKPHIKFQKNDYKLPIPGLRTGLSESQITKNGEIRIRGWCLAHVKIKRIQIWFNEHLWGEATLGLVRNDVFKKFPEYDNRCSGFQYTSKIKTPRLGGNEEFEVRLFDDKGRTYPIKGYLSMRIPEKSKSDSAMQSSNFMQSISYSSSEFHHLKFSSTRVESQSIILVVVHFQPVPATQGNRVVLTQQIRVLRSAGYYVVLLMQYPLKAAEGLVENLSSLVDEVYVVEKLKSKTDQNENRSNVDLYYHGTAKCMQFIAENYSLDAVIAHYVHMAFVFENLPSGIKKILITHDVLSRLPKLGIKLKKSRICSKKEEIHLLRRADVIVAINGFEHNLLEKMVPDREIITVGLANIEWRYVEHTRSEVPTLLYTASGNILNVEGLTWFLDFVWDFVITKVPGASLRVTGNVINALPERLKDVQGVFYLGIVSDLEKEFMNASAVINCTKKGTGLKIKSIEAIARGKALISTSNGVEGIEFSGTPPFLVSDDPRDFAEKLSEVLTSDSTRTNLENKAIEYAKEYLTPQYVYAPLLNSISSKSLQSNVELLVNQNNMDLGKSDYSNKNNSLPFESTGFFQHRRYHSFAIEKQKTEYNVHSRFLRIETVLSTQLYSDLLDGEIARSDGQEIKNSFFTVLDVKPGVLRTRFDAVLPMGMSLYDLVVTLIINGKRVPIEFSYNKIKYQNAGLIGVEWLSNDLIRTHFWTDNSPVTVSFGNTSTKVRVQSKSGKNNPDSDTITVSSPIGKQTFSITPTEGIGQTASHMDRFLDLKVTDDRIIDLRDVHSGQIAWLVGNGPSVRTEDLDRLTGKITFAFNRFHLAHERTILRPTYTVTGDRQMIEDFGQGIVEQSGGKVFVCSEERPVLCGDFFWVRQINGFPSLFSFDPSRYVTPGGSSMYSAMQLAYYMGIRRLYVYGADFSFNFSKVKGSTDPFRSASGDGNHFIKGYRSGRSWAPPSYRNIASSFFSARLLMEREGGGIWNATRGGLLEIFPRLSFDESIKKDNL